jgi:hypothetical protein
VRGPGSFASSRLEMGPRWWVLPEECSLGVSPSREAKCLASRKGETQALVATTMAVAVGTNPTALVAKKCSNSVRGAMLLLKSRRLV